jgi:DNA-binding MarR family transcriptional regulator
MRGDRESRPWPVDLLDEILRLHGRFRSTFADFRRDYGLTESELMVLNAVLEAERPPTMSQIGRSMGLSRQFIQRAANSLINRGLVEQQENPEHKRAALLLPTAEARELKREMNFRAFALAEALDCQVDIDAVRAAIHSLRAVRRAMEAHQRKVQQ